MKNQLKVTYIDIEKLTPYVNNARVHDEANVAQIAASIREFGWTNPILVDGDNGVIAGHGRLLAARKLGLKSVPVIELAGLSDVQKKAYILADNKLTLNSKWDEDILQIELKQLKDVDFDLSITGFDEIEIDDVLHKDDNDKNAYPDAEGEDEVAECKNTICKSGDIWILGDHRLMVADATKIENYDILLGNEINANMIITDPPYNVKYQSQCSFLIKKHIQNDDQRDEAFENFLTAFVQCALNRCDGAQYIFMSSKFFGMLQNVFEKQGGFFCEMLVWVKNISPLNWMDYKYKHEPFLYGWSRRIHHKWYGPRAETSVWETPSPLHATLHPTMKPVAIFKRAILNSSRTGDIVLDPFAGSGTTIIACEETGRIGRCFEIDELFATTIVKRWQDFTNKKAIRMSDGIAFDELNVGEG